MKVKDTGTEGRRNECNEIHIFMGGPASVENQSCFSSRFDWG